MKQLLYVCFLGALAFSSVRADEDADAESEKDSIGTVIGIDLGTTYSW